MHRRRLPSLPRRNVTARSHGASKPRVVAISRWTWEQTGDAEDIDRESFVRLLAKEMQPDGLVREYGVSHGCLWFNAPAGKRTRALCASVETLLPAGWRRAKDGTP
jgi:hypothetical protein